MIRTWMNVLLDKQGILYPTSDGKRRFLELVVFTHMTEVTTMRNFRSLKIFIKEILAVTLNNVIRALGKDYGSILDYQPPQELPEDPP